MQHRYLKQLGGLLATTAIALVLIGCNGKSGANGLNGTNGTNGTNGQDGQNASLTVNAATLTPEQWAALKPTVTVTSVTMGGAPVVNFKITDPNGYGVKGLGAFTAKSATATLTSYPNLSFTMSKLVPQNATTKAPSKWVSYIVTSTPSTTAASAPTRPTSDNTGTLVDNGNGTYSYTFYRDITKVQAALDAATYTAPSVKADLGDVSYAPTLVHRLTIQFSGAARGTGSNTANGVTAVPAVNMANPINLIYDFIPSTGAAVEAKDSGRELVTLDSCNTCHTKLNGSGFHGGTRFEVRYCVVCHTDQRKFGRAENPTTATAPLTFTGTSTYRYYDQAVGDFTALVHRLHSGEFLFEKNYNYGGVIFDEVTYPQPTANCSKCHEKTANTPQADNWNLAPSRLACGSCHGIAKMAADYPLPTGKHAGGVATDDSGCVTCHGPADIKAYHQTISRDYDHNGMMGNPAGDRAGYPLNTADNVPTVGIKSGFGPVIYATSMQNPPAGAYKIAFEIGSVDVVANQAVVKYRILKDGSPVTFNASGSSTLGINKTGYLMDNVDGTPAIYVAYALTQDGVASPADWTANFNATVMDLRDGKAAAGTQTGPDANGYYTATLAKLIPAGAKMVTAGLGYNYNGFVQLNLPAFPGGLRLREPQAVTKLATGFTARRSIVSNAKCNACHGQLGVNPTFHGGARNDGASCAVCHNYSNSNATGHTGANYFYGGGWSISAKDMVHAIHGSHMRTNPFNYEASAANPDGFKEVTYPAILNNCEACHVPGSYDFSATASKNALPNLLWSTAAKADMTIPAGYTGDIIGLSKWMESYVLPKGTPANFTGRANNLVISPISASCFGCHDSAPAVAHMRQNGGVIYSAFGANATTGANPETCMTCHGTGKTADIKTVHQY